MFRITKKIDDDRVTFALSGQMDLAHARELQAAFDEETLSIGLDIRELRGIDREAVPILAWWNAQGIDLVNCPAYLSHWLENIRSQNYPSALLN